MASKKYRQLTLDDALAVATAAAVRVQDQADNIPSWLSQWEQGVFDRVRIIGPSAHGDNSHLGSLVTIDSYGYKYCKVWIGSVCTGYPWASLEPAVRDNTAVREQPATDPSVREQPGEVVKMYRVLTDRIFQDPAKAPEILAAVAPKQRDAKALPHLPWGWGCWWELKTIKGHGYWYLRYRDPNGKLKSKYWCKAG